MPAYKLAISFFLALILGMGCSPHTKAEEYVVKMVTNLDAEQAYYFEPAEITIQPGDTIKWVNVQEDMHNAVADAVPKGAEFFESPMLEEEGASWSHTFKTAGTYSYHCHPHAAMGMKGIITVGAPSKPEEIQNGGHNHDHGAHGHGSGGHTAHSSEKTETATKASATGTIHSVSRMNRKVNLTHAPIPELGWPEMTMDLDVAEGVDLKAFRSNDNVKFSVELGDDKIYRITMLMKVEQPDHTELCQKGMKCGMHEEAAPSATNGHDHDHGGHQH